MIPREHICGGCILNKYIILTAAHCFGEIEPEEAKVRLGSTYYPRVPIYDIAILKLRKPVYQTRTIRYIKLPKKKPRTGTRALMCGWGITGFAASGISAHLRRATVLHIDSKDSASSGWNIYGEFIRETMICAGALDQAACGGDSGNTLVVKNEVVGIASWSCEAQNFPDVYTDIVVLRLWINKAMKALIKKKNPMARKPVIAKYYRNSTTKTDINSQSIKRV
uniref:Peptidase S1 domain-containing protein n=1 Tax=Glossina brevipalpis TaxID=37001 RepID=A0A1A9W2J3_9MUSC